MGIIRYLPWAHAVVMGHKPDKKEKRATFRRVVQLFRHLAQPEGYVYMTMGQKPTEEVLYCYILIDGRIRYRANIVGFEPGNTRECVDGVERTPKWWMILSGPLLKLQPAAVALNPELRMRGFRGFRYRYEEYFDGF